MDEVIAAEKEEVSENIVPETNKEENQEEKETARKSKPSAPAGTHSIATRVSDEVYEACVRRFREKGLTNSAGLSELLEQFVATDEHHPHASDIPTTELSTTDLPETDLSKTADACPEENVPYINPYMAIMTDIKDAMEASRAFGYPLTFENAVYLVRAMRA